MTNRNYYDQKSYAIALAQSSEVDMSLILLQNAIRETSLTKPAQLPPSAFEPFTNQAVTACGLGIQNQQTNLLSTYLQYTNLKVLSNVEAAMYYGSDVVSENVMCTVGSSDTGNSLASTCSGKIKIILNLKSIFYYLKATVDHQFLVKLMALQLLLVSFLLAL